MRFHPQHPRIQAALSELQALIAARFPDATFSVSEGEDPEGVYLSATVDTEDLTNVLEVIGERLVYLQVDEGLPVYVVPTRPLRRVLQEIQQPRPRRRLRIDLGELVRPLQP